MPRKKSENLIPLDKRDAEDRRRIASEGGKRSGEARRRRKATKDLIRDVLNLNVVTTKQLKGKLKRMGYDVDVEGAPTIETLMHINIAKNAIKGDLISARFLMDYAQIPDIKTVLERERIKAQAEGRAKVDLNVNTAEEAGIMDEIKRRLEREETGNREQETGETVVGVAEIATTTKTET